MNSGGEQVQIMQRNLQKLVNQNYFSCFLSDSSQVVEQPANPFQKRLFDKNLRRSTVSLGHYDSLNIQGNNQNDSSLINKSEEQNKNKLDNYSISLEKLKTKPQMKANLIIQEKVKQIKKVKQKKTINHINVYKSQISSIISHFRQQLDYLQEKMHDKVDQYEQRHSEQQISQQAKDRQIKFMIQNLDKILGFMIENCLNLQDDIIQKGNYEFREIIDNQEKNQELKNQITQIAISSKTHKFIKNIKQVQNNIQNNFNQQIISGTLYTNQKNYLKTNKYDQQDKRNKKQVNSKSHRSNDVYLNKGGNLPKSVYEAVLDEREKKMSKMKKKIL